MEKVIKSKRNSIVTINNIIMKIKHLFYVVVLLAVVSCGSTGKQGKKEKTSYVLVETSFGEMKIKLYNETPLHRDNFVKLVKEGFYDSLLFHRVIKDFMIQGGDPDSKGAPAGERLGNGGPGYQINAEFHPALIHKKGVLAAAREGDQVNPEKKSSGSQFYIVQGKAFDDKALDQMEEKINFGTKGKIMRDYITNPANVADKNKLDSLRMARNQQEFNAFIKALELKMQPEFDKAGVFKYTEEQRNAYKTVGGTPHLDQNYTVFGEVIEGLNVIDSIAKVNKDNFDRPLEDVIMKMKVVKK
jgi:cyclophilin family peptidyl-prolyl cis-trans isomerase